LKRDALPAGVQRSKRAIARVLTLRLSPPYPRPDVRIYDLIKPLKDFPKEKVAGFLESLDIWDLRYVHARARTARTSCCTSCCCSTSCCCTSCC
jgi:hypothetical protein